MSSVGDMSPCFAEEAANLEMLVEQVDAMSLCFAEEEAGIARFIGIAGEEARVFDGRGVTAMSMAANDCAVNFSDMGNCSRRVSDTKRQMGK